MTAKGLITQLQKFDPDTEAWLPATTRKGIQTYAAIEPVGDVLEYFFNPDR